MTNPYSKNKNSDQKSLSFLYQETPHVGGVMRRW